MARTAPRRAFGRIPSLFVLLLLTGFFPSAAAFAAALVGDGVTDDTAAIQELLDARTPVVHLPPPAKHYLISKSLRLHSNQTLRLDRSTLVRLAPNSNTGMLVNADPDKGNRNITVSGGIWDGNNTRNAVSKGNRGGKHPHNFFIGSLQLFMNVRGLRVENLTIKDPQKFGIHIAACKEFTVDDITFDYNGKQPNMDGVHLQGGTSHGRITNLKGNTYDDMVALNADDGQTWEITKGAITDIQIDGIWAENCFRAVRFLTASSPVKRISISNIFGSYFRNVVAFTHWRLPLGENGRVEDISISNIFSAKILDEQQVGKLGRDGERRSMALIGCEGGFYVDNLTLSNFVRREWMPDAAPTLYLQYGAKIGTLRLCNIQQVNMTDKPLTFLRNEGSVARLFLDNIVLREKTGEQNARPLAGNGVILNKHGEIFVESEQTLREEARRVDAEVKARPRKEPTL